MSLQVTEDVLDVTWYILLPLWNDTSKKISKFANSTYLIYHIPFIKCLFSQALEELG